MEINTGYGYVSIAKAVKELENKDDIPYFLQSIYIDKKGLLNEFREFEKKVIEAYNEL